jgi:hypothetical protein
VCCGWRRRRRKEEEEEKKKALESLYIYFYFTYSIQRLTTGWTVRGSNPGGR